MKLLICNIGWMKYYQGITQDDTEIYGGGGYNKENIGHEVYNFLNCDGTYYGYVQPANSGEIKIKKIYGNIEILDKNTDNERVEGVTVVWVSRNPNEDRSTIVGWYHNATIYHLIQEHKKYPSQLHKSSKIRNYRITANEEDVVFLPVDDRIFPISRGRAKDNIVGLGQSNVWYANEKNITSAWKDKPETFKKKIRIFRKKLIQYLENTLIEINTLEESGFSANEGKKILRIHLSKDRNPTLVKRKKKETLKKYGCLTCEVCNFDFQKQYVSISEPFCEVHHKIPLSELEENTITNLDDLAILCPNCHRMIHRTNPMLSIEELRKKVNKTYKI